MKKHEAMAVFCMIGATSVLGMYFWYLGHMDPHINWTLMASLMFVCLASSLVIFRSQRRRTYPRPSKQARIVGRRRIFLEMGLAVIGLGLYLWYLRHIHYPINWALVAVLLVVCLAVAFFFIRGKD